MEVTGPPIIICETVDFTSKEDTPHIYTKFYMYFHGVQRISKSTNFMRECPYLGKEGN